MNGVGFDMKKKNSDPECDAKEEQKDEGMSGKLLKTRTILVSDTIDKKLSREVISQLLLLEQESPDEDIKIFINSPGGDADAGFAILDMIKFVKPRVLTICAGVTASAAVIILLGAERENRFSLPNARILIHQPSTGVQGTAADIQIEASEILKCREKINRIISRETGRAIEKVVDDTRRNLWMPAEEALQYGLISKIVATREELPVEGGRLKRGETKNATVKKGG